MDQWLLDLPPIPALHIEVDYWCEAPGALEHKPVAAFVRGRIGYYVRIETCLTGAPDCRNGGRACPEAERCGYGSSFKGVDLDVFQADAFRLAGLSTTPGLSIGPGTARLQLFGPARGLADLYVEAFIRALHDLRAAVQVGIRFGGPLVFARPIAPRLKPSLQVAWIEARSPLLLPSARGGLEDQGWLGRLVYATLNRSRVFYPSFGPYGVGQFEFPPLHGIERRASFERGTLELPGVKSPGATTLAFEGLGAIRCADQPALVVLLDLGAQLGIGEMTAYGFGDFAVHDATPR